MKLLYISNYLYNLNSSICDELCSFDDIELTFLSTSNKDSLIKQKESRTYVINSQSIPDKNIHSFLANFDVIIYGWCMDKRLIKHMPKDKIIFHNSEHYFKKINTPLSIAKRIVRSIELKLRYRKVENLYLLSNSFYLKQEFDFLKIKYKKCYRFGYFTCLEDFKYVPNKNPNSIVFLGRLIKLKRPQFSIIFKREMEKLNKSPFSLTICGEGPMLKKLKKMSKSNDIIFKNFVSKENVPNILNNSTYFCFPSNREEGYGATLLQAMAAGCIVISCTKAGATNYLIKDKFNGFVFKTRKDFTKTIAYISSLSQNELNQIMKNANKSIHEIWNPKIAAERLHNVIVGILDGNVPSYHEGPLSIQ